MRRSEKKRGIDMTKETFEYTIETCDICKRTVKKQPIKKEPRVELILNSYTVSSGIWFTTTDSEIKPVPEHIDMCDQCEESFKNWRESRAFTGKCNCGCQDEK